MNNQSRRVFLKSAGIVGIASLTPNYVFAQKQNTYFMGRQVFLSKILKKTCSLKVLSNTNLFNIYKTALNNWQSTGYQAFGSNFYVCQNENVALFPLYHPHNSMGILDRAILCFGKNDRGEWTKLKPLSGYDLEALAVATEGLLKNNADIDLGDYLLPSCFQNMDNGLCFKTLKGNVFIKTTVSKEVSKTKIIVREGEKVLFEEMSVLSNGQAAMV